jgi:hypothetical protein
MWNKEFSKITLRAKENEFVTISAFTSKRKKTLQFVKQGSGEHLKSLIEKY